MIVSIVGKVEVLRARQWQPVSLRETLLPGDVIKTGPGSRAAILLADESQLKMNANSELELKQVGFPPTKPVPAVVRVLQTILNLIGGEIWIRNAVELFEIQTPAATATIRGTELNLSFGPADEARLAVLEGVVEFHNPQGRVLVQAGEQATAKIGEAPRKTVLISPLDAVQWSLYYPGIVSFRDYPLTDIDPALLLQRLTQAEQRVAAAPDDLSARVELGEILFDLGKKEEARQQFEAAVAIDPQSPRGRAGLGWVYLIEGRVEDALREFRQTEPPTRPALVGTANALYRLDRFEEADRVIVEAKQRFPSSPQPRTQAALLYLIEGRVAEALAELEQALALDPGYALAYGLRSNIYLVQNKKALALDAAEQAIAANPFSPSAYLDLSLVRQAEFRLEDALEAAQKAVELDPEDPRALIQVSRLLLSFGRLSEAFEFAEEARRRAPQDSLVNSTLGFLLLAQFKVPEAMQAFDQAIQADSTRGEPHLGRGLTLFRRNRTEEAVQEMWIATLLEPRVSLFYSYLGKALYEVKRSEEAQNQFSVAKKLDPRDPTPWFYDAILKQSVNRPVEAFHDLQKSIELNDNRAIYRSRLLLDEDLAARGATLAVIYDDVGFQQLALVEGRKSLNIDPANYSAHRFLADAYSVLPRHEIAAVSELLQSQLLQPINVTPVQPQLAASKLFILAGAGPAKTSLNEFNPLFVRDRLYLLASGIVGGNETIGDEVVPYGVGAWGRVSGSLGQFHYQTDGFRENNDLTDNIYNAFVQVSPSYNTSVQAEFRYTDTEKGDLPLRFDPENFSDTLRQEERVKSVRLGFHHAFTPHSDIIASFIYRNADFEADVTLTDVGLELATELTTDEHGYMGELQYLFRSERFNVISGLGHFSADRKDVIKSVLTFFPFPPEVAEAVTDTDLRHTNIYTYLQIKYPKDVTWTVGGSVDVFKGIEDREQFNPKLGLTWSPLPTTTLRAAVFRTLQRTLISSQTIEPTQVAGFNQFFDDGEGTDSWRYGIGLDQKLSAALYAGVEFSGRQMEVPFENIPPPPAPLIPEVRRADWKEYLARAYLYWAPHQWLAASAEYQFEQLERDPEFVGSLELTKVKTHRLPLAINFFHPSGLIAGLQATYFNQDGEFGDPVGGVVVSGDDQFWVVDASIGYRLPNRWGLITVDVRNLFDEKFKFQDTDPVNPRIFPERLILFRLTVSF